MLKRTFENNGESYDLILTEPEQTATGEYRTTVSLTHKGETVWSYEITGIDGVQSTLKGMMFA
ncbi:hypothetical protein FHX77_000462 [Bifidobacterium commune]|uniref:Uncharacterized protein n=1 Tax=Bifidobacterium commune TaxID=1505727 RepID=A0A1C4H3V8_9BIFI|nr:hypothetical protein [Bifidobacterium commune]SCC79412.1 hypothetical protein GA0061077_0715 [Bifidobacterium commune]